MLKTNSKQARQAIRTYIMQQVEKECETEGQTTPYSFSETAQIIFDDFQRVTSYIKGYKASEQALFDTDYAQTLPCMVFDYYAPTAQTETAREILKNALQETDQQAQKYSDTECERMLTYLIYSEIKKAC